MGGDASGADELVSLPLCIGFRFEEPVLCQNQDPLHKLFVLAGLAIWNANDALIWFAVHRAEHEAPSVVVLEFEGRFDRAVARTPPSSAVRSACVRLRLGIGLSVSIRQVGFGRACSTRGCTSRCLRAFFWHLFCCRGDLGVYRRARTNAPGLFPFSHFKPGGNFCRSRLTETPQRKAT